MIKRCYIKKKYINVIIFIPNISESCQMMSLATKRFKIQQLQDKQNQHNVANVNDRSKSFLKENTKTGIEIKNKIKSKNPFKPNSSNKKNTSRKNTHLPEKELKKVLQTRNFNDNDNENMSSTSSLKSMKSVTFSVDSFIEEKENLSQSKSRKGSILKNKLRKDDSLSLLEVRKFQFQKQSRASSSCSHLMSMDQAVENEKSNSIFQRKYDKIVKQMKEIKQKYTDPIYPPCQESIFLQSSNTKQFLSKLNAEGYKIKWMRVTEIFGDKKICIWDASLKSKITKGFIHSSSKQSNYVQNVFNAINKSYIMEKFFENQQIFTQGIYYIKMHQTQTNTWKYILIDDYVPVVVTNKKNQVGKVVKPAFLNIQSDSNIIQIWPLLLQKAFAKYYSTYDSLIKGNTLDFLQQVLGDFYETFSTNFTKERQENNFGKIQLLFKNPYNAIIAENSQGVFYPVKSNLNKIQILDTENNYQPEKIDIDQFEKYFKYIHVIEAKKYSNHINFVIKQESSENSSNLKDNQQKIILRSFTLNETSECTLALTQKEERFHRNFKSTKGKKSYAYSWMRMILVMKQSTGYRWIQGQYECRKTLKMKVNLTPGQYFVIILPEWNTQMFNLKLSLCSNTETFFQRKNLSDYEKIIEESCMDLAQRFGKLIQINSNICSYNYIDYKVGFIIENINNEKTTGQVKILRTIDGLSAYNIGPVNAQFQKTNKLQIRIPSLQSYTVVLKVSGGVDRNFLEQFDFGI